jgi:BirA family biotin operon repressor/biotin-[acetyl-CoA-carboxylase] ligase
LVQARRAGAMIVLTDSIEFAETCISTTGNWRACNIDALEPGVRVLASKLFAGESVMFTEVQGLDHWDCLLAVNKARQSQYDALADIAGSSVELPGGVLCCAAEGARFHGFKGRSWQACRGNIHLSAYVQPDMAVAGGAAGFIVAAVIAALQAAVNVDLQDERPTIKWVNDVLVGGAKVGGVLARLQTQRDTVKGAVVGIGLNVEHKPQVERDPYVPAVAALADFAREPGRCSHGDVFPRLASCLGENISRLYNGEYEALLEIYRQHSLVMDRFVTIREDRRHGPANVIAEGRVKAIGPELELYIEGHSRPVTKGRLVLQGSGQGSGDDHGGPA